MFKRSIHSSSTPKRFERSRRIKTSPGRAHNNTDTNGNTAPPAAPTAKVNVEVFYVHPDHLGTPRVITASTALAATTGTGITSPQTVNKAVWRWDSDPFGSNATANSAPNENPNTLSQVVGTATLPYLFGFDLAFPGQKRDRETGKHYNYFRDYDPSVGRYTKSDPLGLLGGMNLWLYGNASPLRFTDPFGLEATKEKTPLCRDGDCPVPYEPSDNGPKPGGADPPSRAKDKGYERWIEKCAEKQCDVEGWGKVRKWCCEKITISACKRAGANFNCCDCVKHSCISDKRSQGLEEAVAYAYCQSQLLLCIGRMK
ncbi:MAG: RHS repeat-associated core domain-containing protein [Casimicrobium sp.]